MKKIILVMSILVLTLGAAPQASMDQSRSLDFDYRVVFKGLNSLPKESKKLDVWVVGLKGITYSRKINSAIPDIYQAVGPYVEDK